MLDERRPGVDRPSGTADPPLAAWERDAVVLELARLAADLEHADPEQLKRRMKRLTVAQIQLLEVIVKQLAEVS